MRDSIARLLGLDSGAFLSPDAAWEWQIEGSPALWGAWMVVLALAAFWVYRHEGGGITRFGRLFLGAVRFAILAIAFSLLFVPVLVSVTIEPQEEVVIVLVDNSASMTIAGEEYTDGEAFERVVRLFGGEEDRETAVRAARASSRFDLADRILRTGMDTDAIAAVHRIVLFSFASGLEERGSWGGLVGEKDAEGGEVREDRPEPDAGPWVPPPSENPAGRSATRLGDAIRLAVERLSGRPIAGIVLLSDGQSNAGDEPVAVAARLGERRNPIPVYTIPIGSDEPIRDLEVVGFLGNDVAIRGGDPVPLTAILRGRGYPGESVRVLLREGEDAIEERTVTLPEGDGESMEIPFRVDADRVGSRLLTVEVERRPEEILGDNNVMEHAVRVIEQKMRVLYIDRSARWDFRKLWPLLERNREVIESSILLLAAEPDWQQPGTVPIVDIPDDFRDLYNRYDLIVLGDVDPMHPVLRGKFGLIRRFVEEGGGLIAQAGPYYMPSAFTGGPDVAELARVLPVIVEGSGAGTFAEGDSTPFRVRPTDLGHQSPILRMAEGEPEHRRTWADLPPLYWFHPVERTKPLARVLAEAQGVPPNREGDPYPLILQQEYGRGMVLFLAIDSTWRWPRGYPEESDLHPFNRFWGQAIRTLAMRKLLAGGRTLQLSVEGQQHRLGERVVIVVRVVDEREVPPEQRELTVMMRGPDGRIVRVPCRRTGPADPTFEGDVAPDRKGRYELWLGEGEPEGEPDEGFQVGEFTLEFAAPRMNRDEMARIAEASGGMLLEPDEAGRLPGLLAQRTRTIARKSSFWLMEAPLVLVLFAALLVTEWVLRKRYRLI